MSEFKLAPYRELPGHRNASCIACKESLWYEEMYPPYIGLVNEKTNEHYCHKCARDVICLDICVVETDKNVQKDKEK